MLVGFRNNAISFQEHKIRNLRHEAAGATPGRSATRCCLNLSMDAEESMARIKKMLEGKIKLSVSAYDTAWVAMVPSRDSPNKPCFPQCLDWIMENQHQDGSWGLMAKHPSLVKDSLSCTMACMLALTKWRVGERLVQRGLEFFGSHDLSTISKDQICPIGFDIVFPSMMNEAIKLGLNMPFDPAMVDHVISAGNSVIERHKGNVEILAYVAEGLKESYPWEELKNHQRSNGSFFNSPATTAAALIHHYDDKCFEYLCSVLKEYKCGAPTVYSMDIYFRLCMVDTLKRLGVERYFLREVEKILNDTYRCWQLKSKEIFSDVTCCALGFRLLRLHGYEISSDELERFTDQEQFFDTISMPYTNIITVLELYRASTLKIYHNESILDKINDWTSSYLEQQLLDQKILDERLREEVEFDLKNIDCTLERVQSRRSIDLYNEDNFLILKTSYRCSNFVNRDFLLFSIHDFNKCQALHKAEIEQLDRWFIENRLDQIKNIRNTLHIAYFGIAADVFSPELSEARITYAILVAMTTVADDLFDKWGSKEELLNIIDLTKKWDDPLDSDYCTNQAKIFYSALWKTTNEMAARASLKQGRCIKNDIIRLWLEVLECMMKEFDWWIEEVTPTMDEYLSVASVSVSCRLIIFSALCSLVPELPEEVFCSKEYSSLMNHISMITRLMNDLRTYKKEIEERTANMVYVHLNQGQGEVTLEEAIKKIKEIIRNSRRKLLQIIVQTKGSRVPRMGKDLFWTTNKILHFVYSCEDGFSSQKEVTEHMIKKIIYEPINLPPNMD